ncbi:MAG: hydantoinase/oxoprolinase family protein [Rhodobacterales bacterium]
MRLSCDTGGTFTDLAVETSTDILMFKSLTTPDDPVRGILDAVTLAAQHFGLDTATFLSGVESFLHATTRSLNAVLTGNVARTAFLTTEGHPDILVIREGGRADPFNYSLPFPAPYVPRSRTFEIPERIDASGKVVRALDEAAVRKTLTDLAAQEVEAIGVCLLWSIINPAHEKRLGELIREILPGVPYTLSHELNPTLREYRRASAACMDASLKPTMNHYLRSLSERLNGAGFGGRLLMVTSQGGVLDAEAVASSPIHALNSGPAMAPVAGRHYTRRDFDCDTAIVADTGGTSYDVSVVRNGRIPRTKESWIGQPFQGHMTGFPSVDVTSVGAGGGSIAWVDNGNLLHVGPQSATAMPGPACYGRGGTQPTVTDCAAILGYIDPEYFLGGKMALDLPAARKALQTHVASRLGVSVEEAALAVMALTTEKMIGAIEEIAVNQGLDTTSAALIGGGGAGGLNAVAVGNRLNCRAVLIPESGATLSAVGALMSDLYGEFTEVAYMTSDRFDTETATRVVASLRRKCADFIAEYGQGSLKSTIEVAVEARYPKQVWEIEIPVDNENFDDPAAVAQLVQAFHNEHRTLFQISDDESGIEIIAWRAFVRCVLKKAESKADLSATSTGADARRPVYLAGMGWVDVPVRKVAEMAVDTPLEGPAIIESAFTTVVIDPGATVRRTAPGGLVIKF